MTSKSAFGDATTRVKIIEDLTDDDYGIIREPDGPRVEIAIAHDGTIDGVVEAEALSFAIAALPALQAVLEKAIKACAGQFDEDADADPNVPGAELVDWFAQWRLEAKRVLATMTPPPRPDGGQECLNVQ